MRAFLQIAVAASTVFIAIPAAAGQRAFIQVESADIATSEAWYKKAFRLKRVNHFIRPKFDQRILIGQDLILELVQSKPTAPKVEGRKVGIPKAGLEVVDFDRRLAEWRATGIAEPNGLFFDESLGLATILLRDPDNNIVQIFGKSAGPFDVTVKVSPDFKPE
jgi:hypothetical protein